MLLKMIEQGFNDCRVNHEQIHESQFRNLIYGVPGKGAGLASYIKELEHGTLEIQLHFYLLALGFN